MKELSGVRQELTDLQVRLQLVELLDLRARRKTSLQMDIDLQITIPAAATPNCIQRCSAPAWQSYYFFLQVSCKQYESELEQRPVSKA